MLIKHSPDTFEKLHILSGMASDDILSRPEPSGRTRAPYNSRDRSPVPGVYKAAMPNGRFINLMRVMFTDFCMMDCHYCPNSHWVPRKRYAFKVEELARTFAEMYQRQTVNGLFLSSGIAGSPSKTTEHLIKVVEMVRQKYGFKGYIHLKVMPGTEYQYLEAAYRLGTRLSINIETPTPELMRRLSKMRDMKTGILDPMSWIDKLTRNGTNGAIGQATQMVVGAADESDWDIFQRIDQLYTEWNLKRVYYSSFQPVRYTPLEEHPATPMIREHRLYQVDWLKRIYKFSNEEIKLAYDENGFLSHQEDPKTAIALQNINAFPADVNSATYAQLIRIPGVGPTSAQRIVKNRHHSKIDTWRDLQAMGVVRKRAWPFLVFPGHRPPKARQLKLDLFGEAAKAKRARQASSTQTAAPCGEPRSCIGCPMYGAPGHPGYGG